ncbi:MAG: hypothetical protein JSV10_02790, partial [Candidatus Zixiibacteriota bacterium]
MTPERESSVWSRLAQPKWLFWLFRGIIFLSFVVWLLFSPEYDQRIWVPFVFLIAYSFAAFILARRTKGEKFYFLTCLVDLILITSTGVLAGNKQGGFFLLYFLVIPFGAYVSGMIPGL